MRAAVVYSGATICIITARSTVQDHIDPLYEQSNQQAVTFSDLHPDPVKDGDEYLPSLTAEMSELPCPLDTSNYSITSSYTNLL